MSTTLDPTHNTPNQAEARTAHLDGAHVGDILGALGTIRQHDTAPRTTSWKRLLTLAAIMGPGLVVMIGDNDAGGVATYAQAGQNYGTSLLWTLFLLIPVLIVNQEMVVRLGLVSGVGHARLILERFGRFWGLFSVGDLFVLNFLTIVTEFIGLDLGLGYFGISRWLSIPLAAAFLIVATVTGSFRRWERFMYLLIVVNLAVIPLALLGHPHWGQVAHDWLVPSFRGGLNATILLLIIGIVGTTVAPWQLFFQQSNVVDKRLSPRWYRYEFADTIIGSVFTQIGAAGLMIVCAFALAGTHFFGQFTDAGGVAAALTQTIGPIGGVLFALFLIDAALIGAAAVTLSTSYAFGDLFKIKHSLHRSLWDGRAFYAIYGVLVVAAAAVVLFANQNLLGLLTLAVQVLAGILLPSATVFLLLLCNDKAVLGPWVNPTWLNILASLIIGVLVELSLILAAVTLFPTVDAVALTVWLTVALVVGLVVTGGILLRHARHARRAPPSEAHRDRATWRMPPLAELTMPAKTAARDIGLLVLRGYLIVAALLVVVKFVQLALGH
jgi:NRAMP (natural resistance-associated macrophage protein)-like metal ion transporter